MSEPAANKKRDALIARQLADELGVSISTISRAFSPNAVIAEKTRARVLARAAEVGYRPNPFARSLITRRTRIVAIVVSDLTNPFYPEVLTGLTEAIQAAGFNVMLFCRPAAQALDDAVSEALHYQPDVVLVLAATMSSQAATQVIEAGTPVIFFNRYVPDAPAFTVTCDNVAGGAAVADYLIDRDLTRLAFVSGHPEATTNQDRWAGFSRRCNERGLATPRVVEAGEFSHAAGMDAGQTLLSGGQRPTAIFCANDVLALGVLDAARSLDVAVPDAVSVIGFDDIELAGWASYGLTTYRQPVAAMIAATAELIERLAREADAAPEALALAGEIVERRSVAAGMG